MRRYEIKITNPATGASVLPSSLGGMPLASQLPNGLPNPGALDIEFDIPVAYYSAPAGNAYLQIKGLGLQDISSSFSLADMHVEVLAGMGKGLPLANPNQYGRLMLGKIFQPFGNWINTEQTVDMTFVPDAGTEDDPKNLVLNWQPGQTMASALQATLTPAFPAAKLTIAISSRLVVPAQAAGFHYTLDEVGDVAKRMSQSIITDSGYAGVEIAYDGVNLTVTDGTVPVTPLAIAFQDLIGQPTWIDTNTIQCKFVMRGDLALRKTVTLPPSLQTTTQQSLLRFQDKTTFTGNFVINDLHHFGSFRQPDAAAWNTTANMVPELKMVA